MMSVASLLLAAASAAPMGLKAHQQALHAPSKELLDVFDSDGNGQLSLAEVSALLALATALGPCCDAPANGGPCLV